MRVNLSKICRDCKSLKQQSRRVANSNPPRLGFCTIKPCEQLFVHTENNYKGNTWLLFICWFGNLFHPNRSGTRYCPSQQGAVHTLSDPGGDARCQRIIHGRRRERRAYGQRTTVQCAELQWPDKVREQRSRRVRILPILSPL